MNRRRIIAAVISMLFFLFLALEIAGNVDLLLTGGENTPHPLRLISRLITSHRALLLFLILTVASALLIFWAMWGRSYLNYRSDMYEVVPGFSIPKPEGQGQYGTAWFLPKNEYDSAFASTRIEAGIQLDDALAKKYEAERGNSPNEESR